MSETAKITSKNQITIPASVRKSLGVSAGDKVDFISKGGGIYELSARKETFADLKGIIKLDKPITMKKLDGWIADAREAGYHEDGE